MASPQSSTPDIEIAITAVAHGGDGIGRYNDIACFVSGTLPGDTVRARIYRRSKKALWARLLEMLTPSPFRIQQSACAERDCAPVCAWHDFSYPAQGQWKQRIVAESLRRIGGISTEVAFVENPALRTAYRTRAIFHGDAENLGYYAPRTHDVVPLPPCPLNHKRLNEALEALRPLGIRGNIHVTVNPEGDETLVWLREPSEAVQARFPLTDFAASDGRAQFIFDGVPIVNGAFSQASLLLNRMLRRETDQRIGDASSLLDLYCGNGNLSLHYANHCRIIGVDHAHAAIAAANKRAPDTYQCGDEATMAALIAQNTWDVILLDPPRVGAKPIMKSLAEAKARRIIYVSCNPATFSRDAHELVASGWALISTAALDMFPHTPHVETIGVFERSD